MRLQFLAPQHWPVWFLLAVQRLLTLLPWRLQRVIGTGLGAGARLFARARWRTACDNLMLAYPRLDASARRKLARQHFRDLGIGIMEIGMAWWASDRRIAALCDVSGLQHLPPATTSRAGFLVSGHFTSLDMIGRGLGLYARFDAVYRPLGLPLVDAVTRRRRLRFVAHLLDKHKPRELLAALAAGRRVWIAADQADTSAGSVQAPFFGVPVATNTTVSRLAERYDALICPVSCIRQRNGRYTITVEPPLIDFGGAPADDARRLNAVLERQITAAPSQYYWIHRRFKGNDLATPMATDS